jgi:Haem-degrading
VALANVDDVGNVISAARMAQGRARPQRLAIRKAYSAARLGQGTLAYAERLPSQGRTGAEMGDPTLVAVQGECPPCGRRANGTRAWTKGPAGSRVPQSRPGTLRVVGSQPGTTLSLVSSLSRQGMRRGRCGAKQACLTKTWHGACTCSGVHPTGTAPPTLPHLDSGEPVAEAAFDASGHHLELMRLPAIAAHCAWGGPDSWTML